MRVSWIAFGPSIRGRDGSISSEIASLRYRVLAPMRELDGAGFEHRLTTITADTPDAARTQAAHADVLVFSKSFLVSNEALAQHARSLGARVVFDVCDNHYRHPAYGEHYRRMSSLADQVICNTAEMAAVAAPFCAVAPVVIADPYEGPRGSPRFSPGQVPRLLWFGHPSNLDSLQESLPDLVAFSSAQPIALTLLTQLSEGVASVCRQVSDRTAGRLAMSAKPWSLAAQWLELAACDAVIVPSLDSPEKRVKSANRMVEALWAGRPVVAQPMPAYRAFEPWAPASPTLSEGCRRLLSKPSRIAGLISEAQRYIEDRFAPAVVAAQWANVLEAQYARRSAAG
jgi:hypothetical protein